MKIENSYCEPVEITTAADFRKWAEEQVKEMHDMCEDLINEKEKSYWEEVDDSLLSEEQIHDMHSSCGDWYLPEDIKELREDGYNSHAERMLADFVANLDEKTNKSLSTLIGHWNQLCEGCGAEEFENCLNYRIWTDDLIEEDPDFDEKEYTDGFQNY